MKAGAQKDDDEVRRNECDEQAPAWPAWSGAGIAATAQRERDEMVSSSPRTQAGHSAAAAIGRRSNQTGLPDSLKGGIESLSGISMDHVKVHYNSAAPAQLNAHAYAQGSEIHLGPGQERHLPHEAWHVVQQAQGRVRPTMRSAPPQPVQRKLIIGKDEEFESEADLKRKMGYWKQLHGQAVPLAVRDRVLLWLEAGEHKHATMKMAIDAAAAEIAAEQMPRPQDAGPQNMLTLHPGKDSRSGGQESKEEHSDTVAKETVGSISMGLESALNEARDDVPKFITTNKNKIDIDLRNMCAQAKSGKEPLHILELWRFIGTFEFKHITGDKDLAPSCKNLIIIVREKIQTFKLDNFKNLIVLIPDDWGLRELVFKTWESGRIRDEAHGKDSGTVGAISDLRLAQTMGEFLLCLPALKSIMTLGASTRLFKSAHDFAPLVLRVLSGTVRQFKAGSILKLVQFYADRLIQLVYLHETGRISAAAWMGLHGALLAAVQGEGHRGKEQAKMLLALIMHLDANPGERCIGYEPGGESDYDIMMQDGETEGKRVLEVETIPQRERPTAHAFYQKKFEHKLEAIKLMGESKGAVLFLYIPAETILPLDQVLLIKGDQKIRIANLVQIEELARKHHDGVQ